MVYCICLFFFPASSPFSLRSRESLCHVMSSHSVRLGNITYVFVAWDRVEPTRLYMYTCIFLSVCIVSSRCFERFSLRCI